MSGRFSRGRVYSAVAVVVVVVVGAGLAVYLASGPFDRADHAVPTETSTGVSSSAYTSPLPVVRPRVAAVGDSITVGDSPDIVRGDSGAQSWTFYLPRSSMDFVGGWARNGATTAAMLENVSRYDATVVVILAGTNDVANGISFATSAANLSAIVRTVGIARVIISAIPPLDRDTEASTRYNRLLEGYAATQGWEFVDSMVGLREGEHYIPALTTDGIHPTDAGAKIIGTALSAAIAHPPAR